MQYNASSIDARPYFWPFDASLSIDNTAIVIVDMQRDFCEDGGYLTLQGHDIAATRTVILPIQQLLGSCRRNGLLIIHTREGHRPDLAGLGDRELFRSRNNKIGIGIGDHGPLGRVLIRDEQGHDTIPELHPRPGEPVIDKPGKGAFTNTDLDLLLHTRGIRNLLVCGVTTDVCVYTTMREANDRGYDCLLIEDCCAAGEKSFHDATIRTTIMEGGVFGATATLKAVLEAMTCIRR